MNNKKETFVSSIYVNYLKRVLDFFIALFCLIVFSPLIAFCWLAMKRDRSGPALFTQERIGRHGKPFRIYKFRSMYVDAEEDGPDLACENDERLTPTGKFLRSHHLDELPQLWNVLIGDMAFVGYRPERQFFINQIMERDERYRLLYSLRPGVTSFATLYNGYTDSMEKMLKRLEYDLEYMNECSLMTDAKILWLTFSRIVFGKKF